MVPNARLRTRAGVTGRLDELVPAGRWLAILPGDRGVVRTGELLSLLGARQGTLLTVVPAGGLRSAAALPDPVVEDLDGWLIELLRGSPGRLALVRPDRFLVGIASPAELLPALGALRCHRPAAARETSSTA